MRPLPFVRLCAAGLTLAGVLATPMAAAQDYPNRPLRMVVPYAPGGQGDSGTRIVTAAMSQLLGQSIVVDNISGSSGIAAQQNVMRAAPDGYTLAYQDPGHWGINPALYPKLPYDTQRDFTPVGGFATTVLFLVAPASFPATNLRDLVALVKANPDVYTYASSGIGSPHHLTMEDFKAALGLKVLHIFYKSTSQSVPAMIAGQVSMGIAGLQSVAGFIKEGRIRLIAANSRVRSVFAPDVPTMAEAGISNFDHGNLIAMFAPAGTSRAIVDRLNGAIVRALAMPETLQKLAGAGLEPPPSPSPERLLETVRDDKAKYARVIQMAGVKAE